MTKYDENGFSTEPDFTCDMCGYPNDETEVKRTEGNAGMCLCAKCYEQWLKENPE